MKLFRRLLRYLLLVVFIVVLGLAYYYRSLIFSEIINTHVDNTVYGALVWTNIIPERPEVTVEKTEALPECEPLPIAECEPQSAPVCGISIDVTQAIETGVVSCECQVEYAKPQVVDTADGDDPDTEQVIDDEQATDEEQSRGETEEPVIESELEPVNPIPATLTPDENAGVTEAIGTIEVQTEEKSEPEIPVESEAGGGSENELTKSHFELINQARTVFQSGNVSNSINLYQELGDLYPEDPNAYGELGNIYYSKGEWKQASLAYYEAALRLHKLSEKEQIPYLFRIIQGLDPETAEKLRGQLDS